MKKIALKHFAAKLALSLLLLYLLHYSQVSYAAASYVPENGLGINLWWIIGSAILVAWVLFLLVQATIFFRSKQLALGFANAIIVLATALGYAFIHILLAVAAC